MADQTLYLVGGHLVGQLPDDADPLLRHQLLQISLQEDPVIITHLGISATSSCLGLQANLSSPRVIILDGWRVTVEHLVQGRDGFQGRVLL